MLEKWGVTHTHQEEEEVYCCLYCCDWFAFSADKETKGDPKRRSSTVQAPVLTVTYQDVS